MSGRRGEERVLQRERRSEKWEVRSRRRGEMKEGEVKNRRVGIEVDGSSCVVAHCFLLLSAGQVERKGGNSLDPRIFKLDTRRGGENKAQVAARRPFYLTPCS
jgi:hypothetical protein